MQQLRRPGIDNIDNPLTEKITEVSKNEQTTKQTTKQTSYFDNWSCCLFVNCDCCLLV